MPEKSLDHSPATALGAHESKRAITGALLVALAAAFLLCGYEALRSTTNTLFKAAYGKEALPLIMALTPVGVAAMLYGYARLLSSAGPRRTLWWTSLLSGVVILACYFALRGGFAPAAGVLYIVREAYIVLLIEQYWSFINSTLSIPQAKVVNGYILGIGSLGAIAGGELLYHFSETFGTTQMLLFGAGAIIPAALISDWAYKLCGEPSRAEDASAAHKESDPLGLTLFRSHRVLLALLFIVIAAQVISTMTDLSFQGRLQDAIPDPDAQNKWSGRFFSKLNFAAALGQFVFAPLMLRFLPLAAVLLTVPLLNFAACAGLTVSPSLASAGAAYMLFKVCDYSVFRAAKEILYIPLSFNARYRAKETIDVFGYRFSKGAISFSLFALKRGGVAIVESAYAWIAVAAAGIWLLLIVPVARNIKLEK